MSLKCIVFLYVIKYIIVNDCFVICVGSSLLSKTVDVTVKKKLIDKSIKLLNKPKPQISVPKRLLQLPGQEIIDQREVNLPDQKPVVQRGPPQRQLVNDTNLPQVVKQPVNPIPARYFEPSPLLEVPPPSKEPPEVTSLQETRDDRL